MYYHSRLSLFIELITWWLLVKLVKIWATRYMDQFEKFRFKDPTYGYDVFVTISYYDDYPDIFTNLDTGGIGDPNKSLTTDVESV